MDRALHYRGSAPELCQAVRLHSTRGQRSGTFRVLRMLCAALAVLYVPVAVFYAVRG